MIVIILGGDGPLPWSSAVGKSNLYWTHMCVDMENLKWSGVSPGDPASLHEAGWISSSFADGWVAARAAAGSAVCVGVVRTLPLSASQHQKKSNDRAREIKIDLRCWKEKSETKNGCFTWSCSVCCGGTWPCWGLCLWRPSARTSARCSRSCCAGGGWFCSSPLSSCPTCASGVPGMQTGSGGVPDPDWSGDGAWKSGHLLSWRAHVR